jgi:prolyl oligopeptidase PreP (S9A serine peptidase family)
MLNPKFSYKIYNRAGTLIGNLPVNRVKSEPKFSENINGGHAGRANLEETAHVMAMEYTYFWKRLR